MEFRTTYGIVTIESLTGTFGVGDTVVVHFTLSREFQDQYVFDKWLDGNTDNPRTMVIEECGLSVYPVITCKCQDDCHKIKFYHQGLDYFRGDTVVYAERVDIEYIVTFWECLENYMAQSQRPQDDREHFRKMTTCCDICDIITPLDYRTSYKQGEIVIYYNEVYYCKNKYQANTCSSNADVIRGDFFQYDRTLTSAVKTKCRTYGGCEVCDEYLIYLALESVLECQPQPFQFVSDFNCEEVESGLHGILDCNNNSENVNT